MRGTPQRGTGGEGGDKNDEWRIGKTMAFVGTPRWWRQWRAAVTLTCGGMPTTNSGAPGMTFRVQRNAHKYISGDTVAFIGASAKKAQVRCLLLISVPSLACSVRHCGALPGT
jgi:hypothetical protein